MATSKPKAPPHGKTSDTTQAVDDFMRTLDHPLKPSIETVRQAFLAADPSIAEGIKWNAPSFRTTEYFATFNLRAKQGLEIILHLGAKVRDIPPQGLAIDDPGTLLKWLAKDRAMLAFTDMQDFSAKKAAFDALIRHWITHV